MDAGSPQNRAKSEINVTPLIDIVLVLLIVFIVLVPGLTKALPVVVPQTATVVPPPPPDLRNPPVVVEMDGLGQCHVQGRKLPLGDLPAALAPVVQLQPLGHRKVFLKVDEDQTYQAVVNVLDQIRMASDMAKQRTLQQAGLGPHADDGGEIKVAISLRKR